MQAPFWVIGAPRSGTTYLGRVLDAHPRIFLTNEVRLMLLVNRFLAQIPQRRRFLATNRHQVLETLWREMPGLIEQVYRDLGARTDQRWGDKYPQYADSKHDPEALATIDRLFPDSQYVHIIRDPRAVIGSIEKKGWLDLDGSVAAWRNHATHARDFGLEIGLERYLEVRYEDLVVDGHGVMRRILDFLDLPGAPEVDAYLDTETLARRPVSSPIGTPGAVGLDAWRDKLDDQALRRVESELGDLLVEFGYEPVTA